MLTLPKIRPMGLRWGLVVVNFLLLAGFSWQAYAFFAVDQEELTGFTLPDSDSIALRTDDRKKVDHNRVSSMVERLYAEPPKQREDKGPPVEISSGETPQPGGPLKDWSITAVQIMDGHAVAYVVESSGDETSEASTVRSRLTNRVRGRSGRGRRTRRGRGPRARRESMEEGKTFRGDDIMIETVTADPDTVIYWDRRTKKRYTITRELERKSYDGGLEADNSWEADDKAKKANEEIDEADRGRIKTKDPEKKKKKKAAAKLTEARKKAVEDAVDPKKDEQK